MDSKTSVPRDTGLKTEAVREPECLVVLHSGKKGRGFVGGWFKGGSSRSAVGTLKWPGSGASLPFPSLPCSLVPAPRPKLLETLMTLTTPTTWLLVGLACANHQLNTHKGQNIAVNHAHVERYSSSRVEVEAKLALARGISAAVCCRSSAASKLEGLSSSSFCMHEDAMHLYF